MAGMMAQDAALDAGYLAGWYGKPCRSYFDNDILQAEYERGYKIGVADRKDNPHCDACGCDGGHETNCPTGLGGYKFEE